MFLMWLSRVKKYPKVVVFLPNIFFLYKFSYFIIHLSLLACQYISPRVVATVFVSFKMDLTDKFVYSSQNCTEQLLVFTGFEDL